MNGDTAKQPAAAGDTRGGSPALAAALAAAVILAAGLALLDPGYLEPGPGEARVQEPLAEADGRAEAPAAAGTARPAPLSARAFTQDLGPPPAAAPAEAMPPPDEESRLAKLAMPAPAPAQNSGWSLPGATKEQKKPDVADRRVKRRERGKQRRDGPRQAPPSAPAGKAAAAADALEGALMAAGAPARGTTHTIREAAREAARRFIAEHERLTGLRFEAASGYWANTYVPGDPVMRLLEARLQHWNRSALGARIGDVRLEALAQQNRQPFDVPRNAALAAYLHADKAAVRGPARVRVQVGLQASRKRGGLRPDMNVGVVLDLRRPADAATSAAVRALVMALLHARQPGDRFSITVAGHPGGLMVPPESFRHGPVRIAMQSLLASPARARGPAMDLLAALHSAAESVRQDDDAAAPPGASLVLLVSTASMAEQRQSLERLAHADALAGISLSVVAVGAAADLATIDSLVLLGQGHRRVLGRAEDAAGLVDRELHAASQAVARALRLRIRLAPGVKLIDVLGASKLSAREAERARASERSIDRRMARSLGIRADRGADEEGIQILIPSFYAGDSHNVLLDLLIPGPGPVADISVRYKDLVYRRNGIARASLVVADGVRARGPLEYNVLKNHLARVLATAAASAAGQLGAGDGRAARLTVTAARDLVAGMRREIPGLEHDRELENDEVLLSRYLAALDPGFAQSHQDRSRLADSLRYLAFRRLTAPLR